MCSDLEDQVHADDDVEEEVTVKEPEARVSGSETKDNVAVIGHGDGIFRWWQVSLLKVTLQ